MRGPKYVVKKGKTAVLAADGARELLDSIVIAGKRRPTTALAEQMNGRVTGLRDRSFVGVMVCTFARINAVAPDESA